jgi:pimeloyl-ACP methyl ester carboxylesterase
MSKYMIIFVHGAGGSADLWKYQVGHLSKKYETLALDLPGHGALGGKGETTVDGYVEYVRKKMDELSIQSAILAGHSMGGAVVMSLALKYPDRCRALILVGTGAKLRVAPMIFRTIKISYTIAVKMMSKILFSSKPLSEISSWVEEETRKTSAETLIGDFTACDKFDIMNSVGDIKVPTLVICGREDQMTPEKYSVYLKEHIGNSALHVIEGAGHMVTVEKPEEVNMWMEQFVGTMV